MHATADKPYGLRRTLFDWRAIVTRRVSAHARRPTVFRRTFVDTSWRSALIDDAPPVDDGADRRVLSGRRQQVLPYLAQGDRTNDGWPPILTRMSGPSTDEMSGPSTVEMSGPSTDEVRQLRARLDGLTIRDAHRLGRRLRACAALSRKSPWG